MLRSALSLKTVQISQIVPLSRSIHASSVVLAQPVQKKKQVGPAKRGGFVGKKVVESSANQVIREVQVQLDPSLRRDVVASDDLAPVWTPELAVAENANSIMRPSPQLLDKWMETTWNQLPKSLLKDWKVTGQTRALIVRKCTLELMDQVKKLSDGASERVVLTGPPGVGKSAVLLQVATHFADAGWVVLYLPRLSDMVSGFAPYYLTDAKTYDQPEFVAQLLRQFKSVNARQLSNIMMSTSHDPVATPMPGRRGAAASQKLSGMSLEALCDYGIKNVAYAPSVWNILLKELTAESTTRPPLLLAIDQASSLFLDATQYWTADSQPIPSHHLSLVKSLLQLIGGTSFKKGAIVSALDETNTSIRSPFFRDACLNLGEKPDWLEKLKVPVVVSPKIAPGSTSALSQDESMLSMKSVAWKPWTIPRWTEVEIRALTQYLRKARVLVTSTPSLSKEERDIADQQLAQRLLLLSGGVGRRAFVAATQYRAPGTSAKIISQKKLKKMA